MKKLLLTLVINITFIASATEFNLPDTDTILQNVSPTVEKSESIRISPKQKFANEAASQLRKDLKLYGIKAKVSVISISEIPSKEEYALAVEFQSWKDYEQIKDLFYQYPGNNPSYMDLKVFPRVPKLIKAGELTLNKNHSSEELELIGEKIKICWLKNIEKNACVYKCKDGSIYTTPIEQPLPHDNNFPVVTCPQFVFPF